jgi:transcriptional regulator with XRE-family HTH domain
MRARGYSTAVICERLGVTGEGLRRLLSCGQGQTALRIVACCFCGQLIRGGNWLRNNGPVPCLDCLRQRPQTPFAIRLKTFRVSAGWTQQTLARRAQLAVATIRAYECGHQEPKWRNLVKLMKALGTDLVTLGLTCYELAPAAVQGSARANHLGPIAGLFHRNLKLTARL